MKIRSLYALLLIVLVGSLAVSCSYNNQRDRESAENTAPSNKGQAWVQDEESKKNILQIANSSPDHRTLSAAIDAAEIQNVLVNAGPLTVFAPTDQAFEDLPEGTVDNLLKSENKQKLASILTSHASPASLKKEQLTEGLQIYLATGQYVDVQIKDGETYVNGAKVLASISASNGVIHVVDKVFLF